MAERTDTRRRALIETAVGTRHEAFGLQEWGLLAAAATIWGSSFLLIEIGLRAFEPGLVTWLRVLAGAVTLWAIPAARRRIEPEDRARVIAVSILWVGIPFTLFPLAQQWVTSAVTGMINGSLPILAVAIGSLMLRHRPSSSQLWGLALGSVGIALIAIPAASEGSSEAVGVLLLVVAVICYGFALNIAAPLQQRYGALPAMAWMVGLGAIWTAPFGLVSVPASSFSWEALAAVAVLGAVGTGLAFWAMGTLVGRVGGPRASFAIYLVPVVAVVLGVVLLDETVARVSIAGLAFVLAGAMLASRPDRRAPAT
jgi:drug/metabolite transporter (DMT)-like permease